MKFKSLFVLFAAAFAALAVCVVSSGAASAFDPFEIEDPDVKEGNDLYAKGHYEEAVKAFDKAYDRLKNKERGDDWDKLRHAIFFNRGTAYAKSGNLDKASEELLKATTSTDKKLRQAAYYNLGNVAVGQITKGQIGFDEALKKADSAIDFYKRALLAEPSDMDAKYNLETAHKIKEQIEKQKKEREEKNKENQEQNKENDGREQNEQNQAGDKDKQEQNQEKDKEKDPKQDGKDEKKENKQDKPGQSEKEKQEQQQGSDAQAQAGQAKPISEQDAEQLLDSLQENEKPMKFFLFEMQKDKQNADGGGNYKSW